MPRPDREIRLPPPEIETVMRALYWRWVRERIGNLLRHGLAALLDRAMRRGNR